MDDCIGGEFFVTGLSLPEVYHRALECLYRFGFETECPDYNTSQKEISMTMEVTNPFQDPMISKLFIGGPQDLQQYVMEMVDGILDFEVIKGNWRYTYHNRMVNYSMIDTLPANQLEFIIDELTRNPDSRRAVIDIRDNHQDMYSDDPACLQHIQFFIRNNKLNMKVLFRSNDACKAAFMNMFALIMLQKNIADILNIEVGTYTHRANSFHCYQKDYPLLEGYVKRILTEPIEDLCFSYEDDWKELMNSYIPIIECKVKALKGGK